MSFHLPWVILKGKLDQNAVKYLLRNHKSLFLWKNIKLLWFLKSFADWGMVLIRCDGLPCKVTVGGWFDEPESKNLMIFVWGDRESAKKTATSPDWNAVMQWVWPPYYIKAQRTFWLYHISWSFLRTYTTKHTLKM